MCSDVGCSVRSDCYRYRAHPTGVANEAGEWHERQSFFSESPRPENKRKKCPQFWDCSQESVYGPPNLRPLKQADNANEEPEI